MAYYHGKFLILLICIQSTFCGGSFAKQLKLFSLKISTQTDRASTERRSICICQC